MDLLPALYSSELLAPSVPGCDNRRIVKLDRHDTAMRITLHVTAGPHEGRVFAFGGHDMFIVGRSKRAHFRLPVKDKYFSRVHFLLELNPPHCRVLDMASRNGTFVNGKRIRAADLQDGDEIRAGKTLFRVAVENDQAADAPAVENDLAPEPPVVQPRTRSIAKVAASAAKAPAACRVCAAQLPNMDWDQPVCPDCEEAIRGQEQPIAGYQIVREVGRGAMGVVYLALRTTDSSLVALKTIRPTGSVTRVDIERFLREARILQALSHPHIVAFRDMNAADNLLYFTMDYVPGIDGRELVQKSGPLTVPRAVGLIDQLLDALEYAHGQGFVHRDIKPANLLVTESGGQEVVKLADFGFARLYQASQLSGLTMTKDFGGTPAFMAPEQITHFRDAKPAADQYAAAATLYYLLTGQFIYDFPKQAGLRLLLILQEKPVPILKRRADLPRELAAVIHRSLARESVERFADVRALRQALAPFRANR
jgi:serine/threonine-protein kinase